MTGYIDRTEGCINPAWRIKVDGYQEQRFMGYTKAEAIRKYRALYGLTRKHINWFDCTTKERQTLYNEIMEYLRMA